MIKLVVFDLDGTLVDSSRDLAASTNALLTDLGGRPLSEEVVASLVGEGAAVLVRRALDRSGLVADTPGALERFLAHYDARLLDSTRPYPGMLDALRHLQQHQRLAVLTNKPARPTAQILAGLEMTDLFSDVIGGDSPYGRKPDPAGLLALIDRAQVRPEETAMVGDSPVDLATAERAGTRICLARYGFGYRFDGYRFRGDETFVDAASELPAVIESMAG
jgi:phosphoglycolate phosphatase